ncbi:DUF397 domain-containing protein [Amycolatopsis sp. H20-H5]|uniref:DUF397 domain-containing protein n=1 Tax=Amycolatopsis sp. H20-H5 TaxID=3046309 RepID=UPI002DB89828|nr:DUF397 domain-containing protein [Amycolatopsis sp. H20-H5]MEC3975068.1 DUF397 domain-containing protein [Amycolatopsis sp. H20-H5]
MKTEVEYTEWRKSSRSSGGANNCVEVAYAPSTVAVRDTKDRAAGHLTATSDGWSALLAQVRR